MRPSRRPGTSPLHTLGLLPLAVAGWVVVSRLWEWVLQAPHLPRWDMAKYGAAAGRMEQAMESLSPWTLLQEIHQLSSWPFVVPLGEAVVFLFWGNDFEVARALMVVLYGLTCLLAAVLVHRLGNDGLESSLLVWWTLPVLLTSPMLHLYGALNMLEMPGTLLTLLCILLYDVAMTDPQKRRSWWALGVASCVLFFCKYNYGLMWFATLGLAEVHRRAGSWRSAWTLVWNWGWSRSFGPWQIFVSGILVILAWIRFRGGLHLDMGSVEIRATSIGNPVYGLLILQVGRVLLWKGVRKRALDGWRRWSPSSRILGWTLGLPILLWMLVPPHCKDFFGFVENRSSGLSRWSLESTWFYGKSLGENFLAWPELTWPILLLALWGGCRLARSSPLPRLLTLYVVIHSLALWGHPYKLPRFAVTWFVPLVLLAAWAALDVHRTVVVPTLDRLGWRGCRQSRLILGSALAGTMLLVASAAWPPESLDLGFVETGLPNGAAASWARFEEQTVSPSTEKVLDHVLDLAQGGETALLGTWNLFSPSLVEWRRLQRADSEEPLWLGRELERRQRKKAPWPPRVIVIEIEADAWRSDLARANQLETEQQRQWSQALSQSAEYQTLTSTSWPAAGYRLRVLERPVDSAQAPEPSTKAVSYK